MTEIWNEIYQGGQQLNRYPFDQVVTFVYRHRPSKPREETRILEVGCGAGNNLWFAAREGFRVTGLDGSQAAVDYARNRFAEEGLAGDFHVGSFTSLPFENNSFDLAIDRGALTNVPFGLARQAVAEVQRVLLPGGRFFFNPYSDLSTTYAHSRPGDDGMRLDITAGLTGYGPICLWGRRDLDEALAEGWRLLSVQHMERVEWLGSERNTHAEWQVVAEKA